MSSVRAEGVTLRQAALIVGFAYLLNPVSYAEFTIYPKLVIPSNIEQTVANISSHHGLFLTAMFCYLINFIEDIIIAWGLYILLAPVNRALALLAAWFQLVYTAIALFGLFQALFMANAGGAWDNAKKLVEVDLKEKGTPLHAATVVGDTVGDPFKDTSSVAMNPVIKLTTLFGLLAVELAVGLSRSLSATLLDASNTAWK